MKSARLPLLTVAATLVAALLLAAFARSARADDELWQTDFKAALTKAKADKKYVLVDFTGSDWCVWCKKLRSEVFDKEPFKAAAPKQFVLVELDFPNQKKQADELKKQNTELSEKYKVEGFPTVLLMDADGQVIARTGYREGGPEKYLQHLTEFGKIYENVVALKGKLDGIKGLPRAKLLDEIVDGYKKLGNQSDEVTAWSKEIITLDPDNKAGLKIKYEFPSKIEEAQNVAKSGDFAQAKELLDKALALKGVPAEMRQEGYLAKAQICVQQHKFVEVLAALKAAKEAAPESPNAKRIDTYIQTVTKVADAEAVVSKLEAELAKTEGVDRAKLLDKLIDAKQKLPMDHETMESIQKWSKEIVALDADNKAGLKKKYQFKVALAEAMQLAQTGKREEANAALDKALETPDISGEDTQKVLFLKAQLSLSHRDMKEGLSYLKKALEAAPKSDMVPMIKQMLAQFERLNAAKKTEKSEKSDE